MAFHRRLFFLLLLFLPTQLGFHFWPSWSFVLGRRVDYISPTVHVTDILIFCLLMAWIHQRPWNIHISRRTTSVFIGIVSMIIFVGVNSYMAQSFPIAIYKWIKVVEYLGLGWYIVSTKVGISDVVFPLALSIGYSSVIAIIQFIFQRSLGGVFWFIGERSFSIDTPGIARFPLCPSFTTFCTLLLRPYGTFPHPNVLGGYISVFSPLILYYLFQKPRSNAMTWIYRAVLSVGFAALLLTFSRSAWVMALCTVALSLAVFLQMRSTARKAVAPRLLIAIFLCIGITLGAMTYIFHPAAGDESVTRRIELQHAAISMWQHAPIVGVGLGNFLVELPTYTHMRHPNFLQPVHNVGLLVAAELGIFGISSLGILFVWMIKHTHALFSRVSKSRVLVESLYLLPLFLLILLGAIDHYPATLQQGQLMSTLIIALYISKIL